MPVSTIRQCATGPTRNRAISSSGFCVASARSAAPRARPPRPAARASAPGARRAWSRRPRGSRRRCTTRAGEQLLRAAGQHQIQRLRRRDQDVGRLAEHRLALALGRVAGAHRDLQVGADPAQRAPAGCGRCRRRAPSAATRRRADVPAPPPPGARAPALAGSRSIAHRNAASVLPEPVGAEIRTCSPAAIAGHAWACAGVGAAERGPEPVPGARAEGCSSGHRQASVAVASPRTLALSLPDRSPAPKSPPGQIASPSPKPRRSSARSASR